MCAAFQEYSTVYEALEKYVMTMYIYCNPCVFCGHVQWQRRYDPAVSSNVYLGQKSSPTCPFVIPSSNTFNGMPEINKYLFKIQLFPFCFQVRLIIFFSAVP